MTLKVSQRGLIPPFIVMDVMRAANEREAQGEDVLHMEVGQPGTGAPAGVVDAVRAAVGTDKLGYTDAFGLPQLRSAIAAHYQFQYNIDVKPSRIVVTTGSSAGFVLSFLAAFDPGDRVALASPGYPAYRNILSALGVEVVEILTGPDSNFQPTPELLDAEILRTGPVQGLIVASPSNPTGTMVPPEKLKSLIDYCSARHIRFISDEIYHGITYGTVAQTAAAFSRDAVVINSFSKYFSMTGWRLGWMIVPEDLMRSIECLAQNLFISPPTLSQLAGVAAFECRDELDANVRRYAENRKLLLGELPKAGFDRLASADGAFYVYADVGKLTNDSVAFCARMLAETGIAATPGTDFDPSRGHQYVRFSFSGDPEVMAEAMQRLIAWQGT
ncbi:MAG: pyridoxal phosphate-dependent aminotransferase [Rhodospirillales bacterium]|nr:pyridoxal phosphate-dependent aminotransferase [Rhodospirillales bacterium]